MSSVVYYKFKSQKEPSRLTFDGTGISVFDLKREILLANKLATTADGFDLIISNPDTKEEYTDDTEVIPRSMSVIARRMPCARPGKDSAAKYVSGSMPTGGGKNMGRREDAKKAAEVPVAAGPAPTAGYSATPGASEEDMISAMFQAQGEQWKQTQEQMSQKAPIYYSSNSKGGFQAPVPDYPPPPGYLCYRCGQKGHWIQACPTNNDPNWEGKRVRRTTGIPRSMLRTVAKPQDDESGTFMINDDGEYVVAVADDKSWKNFQDKVNAERKANKPSDPELEDPLTHMLFVKPVKTPCCKTTYSDAAIQQALLDSDFVCPKCKTEEVLLDQLTPDEEMEERVNKYKVEHGLAGDEEDKEEEKEVEVSVSTEVKEEPEPEGSAEEPAADVANTWPMMPGLPGMPPMMMPPFMMPPMPGMPPMMMPPMPGMPPMMMPPLLNPKNGSSANLNYDRDSGRDRPEKRRRTDN